MTALVSTDLTTVAIAGTGVFDKLMQVTKLHLIEEFNKGRIRGPEYSQVYLSAMQSSISQAIEFLVQAEQVALIREQTANVVVENANLVKQGTLLDAQAAQVTQQTANLVCEQLKCQAELLILAAELLNIPKQGLLLDAQLAQVTQETANLVIQGTVLTAQECKLSAEFDVLVLQKTKITAEAGLLNQKTATEAAQTGGSISAGSVLGKQNLLYDAQIAGFARDAEQKAASIMLEAFNVEQAIDGLQSRDAAGVGDGDILTVLTRLVAGS